MIFITLDFGGPKFAFIHDLVVDDNYAECETIPLIFLLVSR